MKRFLCGLRGHREVARGTVKLADRPLIGTVESGFGLAPGTKWRLTGYVSCWCGQVAFFEGEPERD